jgi:2-hydroxy-6-oxonona-2,4-dienedioate hydrolase
MTRLPIVILASLLLLGTSAGAQERVEPAAKDATVFGYRLHYLEAGRGEPIILLHGTGGEGARWMPTIQGLAAANFRVIAIDQIGFGQSDKPLTIYHSGVFAGFLSQFMKTIGVPKAAIIGQSMGAGVALYLAVHHPEMVERLVLVDGGGYRSAAETQTAPPNWHNRQIANAGTLEESREYLEKLYYDHSFVTDKLVEQNLILRLRSASTTESMQTANDRGLGGVTEDELREIKAPTLLIWGMNDPLSSVANADKLNGAIKDSRKILFEKAGHYPFLEHADKFIQAVLEFLKSQS